MSFTKVQQEYETLRNEFHVCRRKLDSKCEALLILSKDLDLCRQERDQFKLMAEQVQARYQGMKRQLAGVGPRDTSFDGMEFADMKQQNLAQLLCEMREVNKGQQFEVDDLKQKLNDAQGDIKILREQIARQRVGTTDEGINTRHFPAHEREDLVRQLEESREQFIQIERDLQQVLDEKEELVTERDVYKNKYDRLNTELNFILKGDENRIVDIDALSMENKYLQERLKQMEEEKTMAMATVSKYKSILERKKNKGIIRLGQTRSGGVVISQKQVHQLLENKSSMTPTPKMMSDLQSLASALLETLNDKNLALQHQRKTNKILGTRVSELEKKLKTLEVAGLWNVPDGKASSLQKLRREVEDIQTLIPTAVADSCPQGAPFDKDVSELLQGMDSEDATLCQQGEALRLSLQDLDLLPTKEGSHPLCGPLRQEAQQAGGESDITDNMGNILGNGLGNHLSLSPGSSSPVDEDTDDFDSQELSALLEQATAKVIHQSQGRRHGDASSESRDITDPGDAVQSEEPSSGPNSPECTSPLLTEPDTGSTKTEH